MQRWRLSGTCTHRTSSFIGTQCPTVLSNFINHMITRPAMSKVSSSSPRVFFSREYDVWSHGVCGVAPFTLAQRRGYTTGVPGQDEPRNGAHSSHPSATRAGPVSSTPHSEDPDISMKIFSSTMLHSKFELRTPSASSAPEHDNEAVVNPEGRTHVDPPISAGNIHSSTSEQAKETGSESIPAGPTTESASAFSSLAPTSSSPHDDPPLETESRSGSVVSTDETYVVQAFSQACRRAEGRADQIEAVVWREDTTYPPILSKPGQKNVYYHTDEIPAHVEPFYAHHPQQQREYFRLMSQVVPWWRRLLKWGAVLLGCGAFLYLMALLEVWYHQPREILLLREEILRHAYGTVLELGAGQGTNVGFYPYPAHDVYFMDQDEILLRRLKLRLPKTVFPTYHILQRKVEELDTFPAGSYDTVVDMFGLCHYRDPVFVLRQMQRIVKPTGVILLLEHGRTPYPIVNAFLDWYAEKHQVNTHGCRWNRPLEEYIQESRLLIKEKRCPHFGTTLYVVAYPEVVEETLKSEST